MPASDEHVAAVMRFYCAVIKYTRQLRSGCANWKIFSHPLVMFINTGVDVMGGLIASRTRFSLIVQTGAMSYERVSSLFLPPSSVLGGETHVQQLE